MAVCVQAVKTYVRSIALWSVKFGLQAEQRAKSAKGAVEFSVSPGFHFSHHVRNEDQREKFMAVVRYMFGGDFGFDLESACSSAFPSSDLGSVASTIKRKLEFFERLQLHGQAAEKSFCPYLVDARNSTRSLPNPSSTPRVGSIMLVDGLPGFSGEVVVRIQVSFLFGWRFKLVAFHSLLPLRHFFLSVFRMKMGLSVMFQLWLVSARAHEHNQLTLLCICYRL